MYIIFFCWLVAFKIHIVQNIIKKYQVFELYDSFASCTFGGPSKQAEQPNVQSK